jgi:Mg-chelatase subunit ChlD
VPGRVQLTIKNNNKALLVENTQKVLLELTGGARISDRPGLDLVAVLDVSGSMGGDRIEKRKLAMLFVIKKLTPIDRLSIVTFSTVAERQSKLRQMNQDSQKELEILVGKLNADGWTNTFGGLQKGLQVLKDRKVSEGRTCGIILMSDGEQTIEYGDAAKIPIGNVPAYTFNFGRSMNRKVPTANAAKVNSIHLLTYMFVCFICSPINLLMLLIISI